MPVDEVILVRQPPGSALCGQCCVAMLTGGDLAKAIKAVGHDGGTSWSDLIRGLKTLGVAIGCGPRTIGHSPKPQQCIVRLKSRKWNGADKWGHFCLWTFGCWYDPGYGSSDSKRHHRWEPHVYAASFLQVYYYDPPIEYAEPPEPRRPVQPTFTADEWNKMTRPQRRDVVQRVFALDGFGTLGPAWEIVKQMLASGFSVDWSEWEKGTLCCLLDSPEKRHIGFGPTMSESLCAAALSATGFLLQRKRAHPTLTP